MSTTSDPIKFTEGELDIFGQQPFLSTLYTQISLFYRTTPTSPDAATITQTLSNGLRQLHDAFPWLAGEVVNQGASDSTTGTYKIIPANPPSLIVKDLRDDSSAPSFSALERAHFPARMLSESLWAPRMTLAAFAGQTRFECFLAQATFIDGGVALTFVGLHSAMDVMGQAAAMRLLAKACRGEAYGPEELRAMNVPRKDAIPVLGEGWRPQEGEFAHQVVKSAEASSAPPPECSWAYVVFSPEGMAALKADTMATMPASSAVSFISTDDALSTLVWRLVSRARLARLPGTTKSTFGRAVDVRRYLDLPADYPGMALNMTYVTFTLQELVDLPLGVVASKLREAIDPATSTLGDATRGMATLLMRSPDKNNLNVTAGLDTGSSISLSSWAKTDCYEHDFGMGLGTPVAVRRPVFPTWESLMYLMPRKPDGEMALMICARDEDLQRLQTDAELAGYGRYVC